MHRCDTKLFETQLAFLNGKSIHVTKYTTGDGIPKCINDHPLIFCHENTKYFRHKNIQDTFESNLSTFHAEWQKRFNSEKREVPFEITLDTVFQKSPRRADVLLNDKYILEIQHSYITYQEVEEREEDYNMHEKQVIWLIDGSTNDVECQRRSDNTFIITFNHSWKYRSFKSFILLDIHGKIFKIDVKNINRKIFHAKTYKSVDNVVERLNTNPQNIWDLWPDENTMKPRIIVKQLGAGNGKTYGIWKTISESTDKKQYIIATKQHTAKEVIKHELEDQYDRKEYHLVSKTTIDEDKLKHMKFGKQYKIKYEHIESGQEITVVIGTIDSFIWALTEHSKPGFSNKFDGFCQNIIENGGDKIYNQSIRYACENIYLNQQTELWIDEAQDLSQLYYKAIQRIMKDTKIDCVVVGDKLQSLGEQNNFMTCVDKFNEFIEIKKETPINKNRRIGVKHMDRKLNTIIRFGKFDCEPIEYNDELEDRGDNVVQTFFQPNVYANDFNTSKISILVNEIIEFVDQVVEKYKYKPEDFLFLFPIMKRNVLATELETKLNKYWLQKYPNDHSYRKYAILHKHEEGQVIDTSLSVHSSRIMSIQASKGDGRPVVFVLNCTEAALKIVSRQNNCDNIVYESFVHVALTRAKEKIFFALHKEIHDDIFYRFEEVQTIAFPPQIKQSFKIDDILQYIDMQACSNLLEETGVLQRCIIENENIQKQDDLMEYDVHCIRRSVYLTRAENEIIKYLSEKNYPLYKNAIPCILNKISKLKLKKETPKEFFQFIHDSAEKNALGELKEFTYFSICDFSDKNEKYIEICQQIFNIMKKIQIHIKQNKFLNDLTVLECVVMQYMIDIFQNRNYHTFTPNALYGIVNAFTDSDQIKLQEFIEESKNIDINVSKVMNKIYSHESNIMWNIGKNVFFEKKRTSEEIQLDLKPDKDIFLLNTFNLVGYSDKNIYVMQFQTDYTEINKTETLIKLLLLQFLLKHPSADDDKARYCNKKIIMYLVCLKNNTFQEFCWENEIFNNLHNIQRIKELFRNALLKYFQQFNDPVLQYLKFMYDRYRRYRNNNNQESFFDSILKSKVFVKNSYIKNLLSTYQLKNEKESKEILKYHFKKELDERLIYMLNSFVGYHTQECEEDTSDDEPLYKIQKTK